METKTEWYKKLAKKLERIKTGELSLDDYIKEVDAKIENGNEALGLGAVSGSAIKPPLGLIPKKFHDERVKVERFNEVCGAIARYYDAGLKINIEWIEEYNELVECVGKHYR